ncbi:hypothetical protein C5167_039347 [Papaver somniferum]|uniref:Uncharacterized protein n=1 Tax=Papaver somniferum TaxID=3469 RepID=A0A4Y7IBV5_PAPSO|nr:hypothetical protein C5167_039347 [Papaver somniferum]
MSRRGRRKFRGKVYNIDLGGKFSFQDDAEEWKNKVTMWKPWIFKSVIQSRLVNNLGTYRLHQNNTDSESDSRLEHNYAISLEAKQNLELGTARFETNEEGGMMEMPYLSKFINEVGTFAIDRSHSLLLGFPFVSQTYQSGVAENSKVEALANVYSSSYHAIDSYAVELASR